MEFKRYLSIVVRHRWLALVVFVLTVGATAYLSFSQDSYYESSGTLVVRPRVDDSSDVIRAIDTLARGGEINATYAAIAESDHIRDRAEQRLGPDGSLGDTDVSAAVLTGTNLITITVTGGSPQEVQELAEALGAETVAYVDELGDVFQLAPLDDPKVPGSPAGPNRTFNMILGSIFALVLVVVVAVAAERLHVPPA